MCIWKCDNSLSGYFSSDPPESPVPERSNRLRLTIFPRASPGRVPEKMGKTECVRARSRVSDLYRHNLSVCLLRVDDVCGPYNWFCFIS